MLRSVRSRDLEKLSEVEISREKCSEVEISPESRGFHRSRDFNRKVIRK